MISPPHGAVAELFILSCRGLAVLSACSKNDGRCATPGIQPRKRGEERRAPVVLHLLAEPWRRHGRPAPPPWRQRRQSEPDGARSGTSCNAGSPNRARPVQARAPRSERPRERSAGDPRTAWCSTPVPLLAERDHSIARPPPSGPTRNAVSLVRVTRPAPYRHRRHRSRGVTSTSRHGRARTR